MKKIVVDCQTGEVTEREMTNTELAQYEKDQKFNQTAKSEAEAQATAKAALLAKLGISEAEAKLLLS